MDQIQFTLYPMTMIYQFWQNETRYDANVCWAAMFTNCNILLHLMTP